MSIKKTINETHLEFIQRTISRLSSYAFQAKTWCISLVSALIVFFLQYDVSDNINLCFSICVFATVLFWFINAYYLYLERGYRDLYNIAAGLSTHRVVTEFDMRIPKSSKGVIRFLFAFLSVGACIFYLGIIFGLLVLRFIIF